MKKLSFLLSLLIIPKSLYSYKIRKGDTLSELAQKKVYEPVYGEKGSLQFLLNLNKQIENPDLIEVGLIIKLKKIRPFKKEKRSAKTKKQSDEKIKINDPSLSIALGPSFIALNSQTKSGSRASSLSRSGYIGHINYKDKLSEILSALGQISLSSYDFEVESSKRLNKSRSFQYELLLGLEVKTNDIINSQLLGTYKKWPALLAVDSDELNIEAFETFSVTLANFAKLSFFKQKRIHLGVFLELFAPGKSDSIDSKSGYGYGLIFKQGFKKNLFLEVIYNNHLIELDNSDLNNTSLNLLLGFKY